MIYLFLLLCKDKLVTFEGELISLKQLLSYLLRLKFARLYYSVLHFFRYHKEIREKGLKYYGSFFNPKFKCSELADYVQKDSFHIDPLIQELLAKAENLPDIKDIYEETEIEEEIDQSSEFLYDGLHKFWAKPTDTLFTRYIFERKMTLPQLVEKSDYSLDNLTLLSSSILLLFFRPYITQKRSAKGGFSLEWKDDSIKFNISKDLSFTFNTDNWLFFVDVFLRLFPPAFLLESTSYYEYPYLPRENITAPFMDTTLQYVFDPINQIAKISFK